MNLYTTSNTTTVLETVPTNLVVFFRHLRLGDAKNMYLPGPKGGATFLIHFNPAGQSLEFAVAVCSEDDLFNFEMGRAIATEKMQIRETYSINNYRARFSMLGNIYEALKDFKKNPDLSAPPSRYQPYLEGMPRTPRINSEVSKLIKYFRNQSI